MAVAAYAPLASGQGLDSATVAGFRWRTIGPAIFMGRTSDVQGIASPSKTLYLAGASGGIWKSMNNGVTWRPIFDNQDVSAFGVLAISESDTNVVWAGTGGPNSRNTIEPGDGVYKSTDGGEHWTKMGLEQSQHIGRIAIDPRNPNVVYVAALGPAWKAGGQRGLYKTTDGGATWTLAKAGANDRTGFVDVAIDPTNSNVVYASSYERLRTPYSLKSGGVGSGLWKSTDAGATWTEIKGNGYPAGVKGRIGISIARSNPNVVYALTEAAGMEASTTYTPQDNPKANGLYRSTDAGKTWTQMNNIDVRPFYYSQVRADPKNPDRVYFSSTTMQVSNDGGKTSENETVGVHVDDHGLWIDPNDPQRWVIANDGGVAITFDQGKNFFYPQNVPIGQFYEISYDYAVPYNVCSGAQDNGAWCGPSRKARGTITNADWFTISGGDGFYTAQDPTDPNMVWGESQNAGIQQTNLATGARGRVNKPSGAERDAMWRDSIAIARGDVSQPETPAMRARIAGYRAKEAADSAAFDIRYNWNSPYFLSPHDPHTFYLGGSRVLKSTKGGEDLYPISPDLSKSVMPKYAKEFAARVDTSEKWTGGVTLDATGAETYGDVVTLAESPIKAGMLLAGTDDGNLWVTHNDGGSWEDLTDNVPGLPSKDVYVTRVEPSHFDTLTFYVAFENHRWNDFKPYLYVTNDGGKTFKSIANNLPATSPQDYLHVVREDPHNRDLLFVGSSRSAYVSINRGETWTKFADGLPSVPVMDLQVHPRDHDLMAATHGRSLWIVNIAALEDMNNKTLAGDYLFKPGTAYEFGNHPDMGTTGNGNGQAQWESPSPAYGADITYRLASRASGPVRLHVLDAGGDTLATLTGPATPGVHHVTWSFTGRAPAATTAAELSPAQKMDSALLKVRAPMVLDSLRKAGYDTGAVNRVAAQIKALLTPRPNAAAAFARGGGGGRGGAAGATATCEHPATMWDTFCAAPAVQEARGGAGGGRGRGGADSATVALFQPYVPVGTAAASGTPTRNRRGGAGAGEVLNPVERIWNIIGMPMPSVGGRRGGGFGAFAGGGIAEAGDYLVVMEANGHTYKQTLRVERANAGGDGGFGFGADGANGGSDQP